MHSQLTQEQRCQIEALASIGEKQTTLAGVVGVHPSTISRETSRNQPPGKQGCLGIRELT